MLYTIKNLKSGKVEYLAKGGMCYIEGILGAKCMCKQVANETKTEENDKNKA